MISGMVRSCAHRCDRVLPIYASEGHLAAVEISAKFYRKTALTDGHGIFGIAGVANMATTPISRRCLSFLRDELHNLSDGDCLSLVS